MRGRRIISGGVVLASLLLAAALGVAEAVAPTLAGIEVLLPPDARDAARWTRMVKDLSLLRRIFPKLTPTSFDRIHASAPDDLTRLLEHLASGQAARLVARYPDLAKETASGGSQTR